MKKHERVLYSIAALVDLGEETASSADFKKKMRTVLHVTMGTFLAHRGALLVIDEPIKDLILGRADAGAIRARAVAGGMSLLRDDGWDKVRRGLTTVEEVLRVTRGN